MTFSENSNLISKKEFVDLYNKTFANKFIFIPLKTISNKDLNKFINAIIGTVLLYEELRNITNITKLKNKDNTSLSFWFYDGYLSFSDFIFYGKTCPFIKVAYDQNKYNCKNTKIYSSTSLINKYIIEGNRPKMEISAYEILKSKVLSPMFTKYSAYGIFPKINLNEIGDCNWRTSIEWKGLEYDTIQTKNIENKNHIVSSYCIRILISQNKEEIKKIIDCIKNYKMISNS